MALTPAAKQFIIDSAYDPAFGARPLRRFVQHGVETLISRKIIGDQVQPGDTLTVDCVGGELTVRVEGARFSARLQLRGAPGEVEGQPRDLCGRGPE